MALIMVDKKKCAPTWLDAWANARKRTSSTPMTGQTSLLDLPDEILVKCCLNSLRLCTTAAMTSKSVKKKLVHGAKEGLRLAAYDPRFATHAEEVGPFCVKEMLVSSWPGANLSIRRCRSVIRKVFTSCKKLVVIELGPEHSDKARALTRHARATVRAGVEVRCRAPVREAPWKIASSRLMEMWLGLPPRDLRPSYYELVQENYGSSDDDETERSDSDANDEAIAMIFYDHAI
jgi:hypothetical protein